MADPSKLEPGTAVWWHDAGRAPEPSRQGRVVHAEDSAGTIAPGDGATVVRAPNWVHLADEIPPVHRCSLCLGGS
jgi:hypothetical protein